MKDIKKYKFVIPLINTFRDAKTFYPFKMLVKGFLPLNIGIIHDFLCINICWAPRDVLKPSLRGPDQKSMFDRYYCSKSLEKLLQEVLFTSTYNGAEKHVTCERFENDASRTKTNDIATVHFTDDDVSFYYGPGMFIRKTAKPCINSAWIALLIHGFVLVKTLLLIACDTAFYAIILFII